MDNHDKKTRSYNMSRIRSTNSKPEELVRKFLFSKGLRYRKNVRKLPGCPDIVLPKYKTIIFINGCFWHMHENCPKFVWPKSNIDYWEKKILNNVTRDKENQEKLKTMGWNIIIVWECQLKKKIQEQTLNDLYNSIIKYNR